MSQSTRRSKFFRLASKPEYILLAMIAIVWIIIVRLMLPRETIPYVFEEFLVMPANFWSVFWTALPLFVVGFTVNFIKMAVTTNPPEVHENASVIPIEGFSTSLIAGLFEELTFRWVLLYGFMGLFWALDRVLFTIFGVGVLEEFSKALLWWIPSIMIKPSSNILDHPGTWTIALAILASNWKFQEGHIYQGLLGLVLSGFGGLIFFHIMLNDGLIAAIITHFLFDLMVFVMLFFDVINEISMGKTTSKNKIYHWYSAD